MSILSWYLDKPHHLSRLHDLLRGACMVRASYKCRSNLLHCEWITDALLEDLLMGKISGFSSVHSAGTQEFEKALLTYLVSSILPKKIADFYRLKTNTSVQSLGDFSFNEQAEEEQIAWLIGQELCDPTSENLDTKQIREKLLACINNLSPKLKDVCLRYLQDKDPEEIEVELSLNAHTLRTRLRDSIQKLKLCMAVFLTHPKAR